MISFLIFIEKSITELIITSKHIITNSFKITAIEWSNRKILYKNFSNRGRIERGIFIKSKIFT